MRFSGSKAQIEKYWGQTKKKFLEFPSLKIFHGDPVDRYLWGRWCSIRLEHKRKAGKKRISFLPGHLHNQTFISVA